MTLGAHWVEADGCNRQYPSIGSIPKYKLRCNVGVIDPTKKQVYIGYEVGDVLGIADIESVPPVIDAKKKKKHIEAHMFRLKLSPKQCQECGIDVVRGKQLLCFSREGLSCIIDHVKKQRSEEAKVARIIQKNPIADAFEGFTLDEEQPKETGGVLYNIIEKSSSKPIYVGITSAKQQGKRSLE